ncbi:MAG: hypothetical protein ABL930_01510 [Pseudobdellovibrio sp.]
MKDFIKIFLGISALVTAFILGRGYGEKSFKESEEYRSFIKSNEDLNFSKNELENVKAKLQNIADGAENKKTDELLGQILTVFLNDLGLRLQNKEAILKQAQEIKAATSEVKTTVAEAPAGETDEQKKLREELKALKEQKKWTNLDLGKYKSTEWILQNATTDRQVKEQLTKVRIKNMNSFLSGTINGDEAQINGFMGEYRGKFEYIDGTRAGSLKMKFSKTTKEGARLAVEIGMYGADGKTTTSETNTPGGFGIHQAELDGIVTKWQDTSFFHFYKLKNKNQIAGNLYQSLPNGATTTIGSYILNRVDKF